MNLMETKALVIGTAILVGSLLMYPQTRDKNTPFIGAAVVGVGFTMELRHLNLKKDKTVKMKLRIKKRKTS